jgi:hypothetical protein
VKNLLFFELNGEIRNMSKVSSKSNGDDELDLKINIEQCVQSQIIHLSSESEDQEIKRPGTFSNGRRTNSKLVYPIIYIGNQESSSPLVLGIVMTGLCGRSIIFGYSLLELNIEIQSEITELLEFEGFPVKSSFGKPMNWEAKTVVDVLLEYKKALILLPNDVLFARKKGWNRLIEDVKTGVRSTNRTAVNKLGRMALKTEKQRTAYKQISDELF